MTSSRGPFPYLQHTSLLGTHTLVLVFAALFLPRSTLLVASLPRQQSSLDKPQHLFLVPITASPVLTLAWLCAGVGACQAWWAGWMRQWWRSSNDTGAVVRSAEGKLKALYSALANTIICSIVFHVVVILFGAPITSHVLHTYLLSSLISILTVFVPTYTLSLSILGIDSVPFHVALLARSDTPMKRNLVYPVLGALLGAWTGVFPIPLDWDRPWQAWPLTPAYGAIAGHMMGAWFAVIVNAVLLFAVAGRELQRPENTVEKRRKKKAE